MKKLSRHPVGYEVLVCSKALLGAILGVSWLIPARGAGVSSKFHAECFDRSVIRAKKKVSGFVFRVSGSGV